MPTMTRGGGGKEDDAIDGADAASSGCAAVPLRFLLKKSLNELMVEMPTCAPQRRRIEERARREKRERKKTSEKRKPFLDLRRVSPRLSPLRRR